MYINHTINYYQGLADRANYADTTIIKNYIKNYCFTTNSSSPSPTIPVVYQELISEITPGNSIITKLTLVDNLIFKYVNMSSFDNTSVMKIFTIEKEGVLRCFTARGKHSIFNPPDEHTLPDFLFLLNTHPDLKDDEMITRMKSTILYNQLQNNLSNKNDTNKKYKI